MSRQHERKVLERGREPSERSRERRRVVEEDRPAAPLGVGTRSVVARLTKNKNCKQPCRPDHSHGTVEATPWGPRRRAPRTRTPLLSRAAHSFSHFFLSLTSSRSHDDDPVALSQRAARRYVIASRSRGVLRAWRTALRRIRVVFLHNKPHFRAE